MHVRIQSRVRTCIVCYIFFVTVYTVPIAKFIQYDASWSAIWLCGELCVVFFFDWGTSFLVPGERIQFCCSGFSGYLRTWARLSLAKQKTKKATLRNKSKCEFAGELNLRTLAGPCNLKRVHSRRMSKIALRLALGITCGGFVLGHSVAPPTGLVTCFALRKTGLSYEIHGVKI